MSVKCLEFLGVVEYLTTEISSSRAKNFNMVSFVDSPGLVDGDMHYPFDVNDALLWLGNANHCFESFVIVEGSYSIFIINRYIF